MDSRNTRKTFDLMLSSPLAPIRLLNVEPAVKKVFKFKDGEDFRKHPSFELHARETVDRLDMAVSLLGPDLEPLEEDFRDLGLRHMAYGVKSDYLPSMAKALIGAIEVVLKDEFSKKEKEAWEAVFGFLVSNMDMGMKPGEW